MKPGDRVEWTSQSQGRSTTKRGEIIVVVPAGKQARKYAPRYACSNIWNFGHSRNHESYLVKVDGKGNHLYWPRVAHLKAISAKSSFPLEKLKTLLADRLTALKTKRVRLENIAGYSIAGYEREKEIAAVVNKIEELIFAISLIKSLEEENEGHP